jgi:3-oxoadipate enol-lactonase/4-carboxymuconolactone decarboxylase
MTGSGISPRHDRFVNLRDTRIDEDLMAIARNGNVRLHWREDGAGAPLLLLNSVGCDLAIWDKVVAHLKGFRVLRMDMRGHGPSDSPPGDYTLDQIASDALAVLDAAGVDKAAICGLSLGGMTAMTLGLNAPSRISALVLACTSAQMDRQVWDARITAVRGQGMAAVAEPVMTRFFSEEFRRDHAPEVDAIRSRFLKLDAEAYAGCCAAIRDMNLLDRIAGIGAPTLIIAGNKDAATPFEGHGSEIRKRIAQAAVSMVPAGHIAPVEKPDIFAALVTDFLSGLSRAG